MSERLGTIGVVASLLFVGFLAFMKAENPVGWVVVPLLVSGAWMLGRPKRLLAGYWLYACVAEYLYHLTGMQQVRLGDEALLGLIIVALVFEQALWRRYSPDLRPLLVVFWLLVVLLVLSYVVNRGSPLKAAVTGIQYYRPLILGYLAYTSLGKDDLPMVGGIFIGTLLVQLLINISWLIGLSPIPHPGIYVGVDFAVGTMGSSLIVGYTSCMGVILCISLFLVFLRPVYLLLTGAMLMSFALTSTLHGYAFLTVMLFVLALIPSGRPLLRISAVFGAACSVVAALYLAQLLMPSGSINLDQYVKRGADLLTGRKVAAYTQHVRDLPEDVPIFLLGAGPANLGCAMTDERGYLPAKYHGWGFTYGELTERIGGSIISHTRTGFLSIWGDMGPLAFLLYWGAHVYAMLHVARAYRRNAYESPWQRALALSFVPMMTLYLMAAFMTDLVHMALWGFIPWVWASTVWTPQQADAVSETEPETSLPAPEEGSVAAKA